MNRYKCLLHFCYSDFKPVSTSERWAWLQQSPNQKLNE